MANKGIKSLWGYPLIDEKARNVIDDVRSNLENNFQKKTDDTLGTTDKTVPGAINEVKNSIDTIGDNFTSEQSETKYDMKYKGKSIGSINIELEEDQIAGGDGSFNIDLTPYQTKNDDNLTTTNKTISGAINEVKNDIGNKDTLTTTDKTIVGSINEVNTQYKDIMHVDLRQFPKKIGESDDTKRIQRAIDHINNNANSDFFDTGYGVLNIPPGVYDVKTLVLKSNVHIQGSGMGVTRINPIGNSGYVFNTIGTSATVKMSQCEIKDLSISPACRAGGDVTNSSVGGINFEFAERCTVENVRITNINGIGIKNLENFDSFFQNIELMYVGDNENPALLLDGTTKDATNAIHVIGVRIEQCPILLKLTNGVRSNQFIGCKFEGGRIIIEQCNSNVFEGCDFVSISTDKAMIKIGTTVNDIRGLKFNGCSFLAAGVHEDIGIEGDATAMAITLTNCNFTGMKKSISGNGFFNIIGCEFMDCLAPVIELERGRINSCVLTYTAGNESVLHLKGSVICKDCYITSNNSVSNGINITDGSIVCDNMLSFLNTAITCVGTNNVIKGNIISNSTTEYSINDKSQNKIYDRFGEPIV